MDGLTPHVYPFFLLSTLSDFLSCFLLLLCAGLSGCAFVTFDNLASAKAAVEGINDIVKMEGVCPESALISCPVSDRDFACASLLTAVSFPVPFSLSHSLFLLLFLSSP